MKHLFKIVYREFLANKMTLLEENGVPACKYLNDSIIYFLGKKPYYNDVDSLYIEYGIFK